MSAQGQTVLLISDDAMLCAEARRELQAQEEGLRVSSVSSVDAARRIVEDSAPTVIVLEEASAGCQAEDPRIKVPRLDAVVSSLAAYAPVVVLGPERRPTELSALIAAGAAEYVGTNGKYLPEAASLVRRRLDQARHMGISAEFLREHVDNKNADGSEEDFGEILRHELNNPLTGILGNAELLLAELRRKSDERMPHGGLQRLETIAALAVRMRETIRRLSQQWEERSLSARTP
ncbi:MAG TPA: histidine kinase dimerization/phospho-acceptor domain-containing protein [Candidatus Acidoferrum sp.]|nr:histidine kinase dimerization/phospho-acceptor domain-containing protein [Candidatus Acidoferrum sp.]